MRKTAGNNKFPRKLPSDPGGVHGADHRYQSAITAAADGGRFLIILKKNAREALLTGLRSWAVLVGQQCQGDLTVLFSSGFAVRKPASPVAPLPALGLLVLRATLKSGQISVRTPAIANGRIYACGKRDRHVSVP